MNFTKEHIYKLISKLVKASVEDCGFQINVLDPTCNDGSLMLEIEKEIKDHHYIKLIGQDIDFDKELKARENLKFLNNSCIFKGDSLKDDRKVDILLALNENKKPIFDIVAFIPPFSYRWVFNEDYRNDDRFKYGLAPKSAADFAFLLHGLSYLKDEGVLIMISPLGCLFRGGEEKEIRVNLIKYGNIDTIIELPSNLMPKTGVPTCILIVRKKKKFDDIFFINANNEFIKGKRQNILSDENIDKIVNTYQYRKEDKFKLYSRKVFIDEVKKRDYNLYPYHYFKDAKEADLYCI